MEYGFGFGEYFKGVWRAKKGAGAAFAGKSGRMAMPEPVAVSLSRLPEVRGSRCYPHRAGSSPSEGLAI